jgi:hypothetical protein
MKINKIIIIVLLLLLLVCLFEMGYAVTVRKISICLQTFPLLKLPILIIIAWVGYKLLSFHELKWVKTLWLFLYTITFVLTLTIILLAQFSVIKLAHLSILTFFLTPLPFAVFWYLPKVINNKTRQT